MGKSKKCWAMHLRMMRRAAHEKRVKHYHKKRHAMHEKRLKANKKRRAAHEKRVKQHHHKRRAVHEKSLKANMKHRAAHEKRVKHYHNKRRAMHEKRMKQSKKGPFPVVYQHCNFGGYHRTVKRSVNWVKKMGVKNDDLSSIKVPAGKCVRLYEHIHYKGRSWTICGKKHIKCFVHHKMSKNKTWNDQVSSIKVFNKPQKKSKKSTKKGSSSAKYAAKKAALHRRKAYYAGRTERYYASQERRFARRARWPRQQPKARRLAKPPICVSVWPRPRTWKSLA